jgi:tetraacyldisaccharide 4'-kinase
LSTLGALYGRVATARRAWYRRRHQAVRRLPHPVISVGNLVVGGSGKTPVVALVARTLLEHGHRPAVLSRGYARRQFQDGVVVVSDGRRVLEPVERAGDEPCMLAHALPGVPVLVSGDRYLAGQLGAHRFGTTVSILDDGFQHLQLARDVDLLLASPSDLDEDVLPAGRLREPLGAAAAAHAVIVHGSAEEAALVAARLGVAQCFTAATHMGGPRAVPAPGGGAGRGDEDASVVVPAPGDRVYVASGIARPERFLASLEYQGWRVADYRAFRDHHWFTAADLARIDAAATAAGATCVVTTEKDAVRLSAVGVRPRLPWFSMPVEVAVNPAGEFVAWLLERLTSGRASPDPAMPMHR